jgi:hypothetical protein
LIEDLDLARSLATALVDNDGAPIPGIAGGGASSCVDTSLENLTARFENMENLLVGILDRPSTGQPWRGVVGEALKRCRTRLEELRRHRRQTIATVAALPVTSHPGEWLG